MILTNHSVHDLDSLLRLKVTEKGIFGLSPFLSNGARQ